MSFKVDDPPATYKVYRQYKDKCENDWDGDIFPDKTHGNEPAAAAAAEPPPYIVLVQGPPNVGKSLLIKSLVRYFTNMEEERNIRGPITIVTGDRRRRLQFVECPDDFNAMIDASKYADLVLFMVDASYGFEVETFEFLHLLQAHGLPKVMGVFTHLDKFKDETELKETKERLTDHFGTEICEGATISYMSGLDREFRYKMEEVQQLAEHILMLQPRSSSSWRAAHPYVLVDRIEDVSPTGKLYYIRNIIMYGYLRGCNIKAGAKVHIAGVGDFCLAGVRSATDPFPLSPDTKKGKDFVESTHRKNEIFTTGAYLRLEVYDVPFEVVANFDPCHPILVGGISLEEEDNFGQMQARLKGHNWRINQLKSEDPVTVSAGWRRYQTKPIYACDGKNGWCQIPDFYPEHKQCLAMFWGPLAPPGTRIVLVHGNKEAFRIAAKAVALDYKHPLKIMNKHRLDAKTRRILAGTSLITPVWFEVVAPLCENIVPVNKNSLKKDGDPGQRRLRLEQRRRVEIIDGEPDYSRMYMLLANLTCKKETMVVISNGKREELINKQIKEWTDERRNARKSIHSLGAKSYKWQLNQA